LAIQRELGLDTTASGADEVEIDRRVNEGATDFMLRTGIKVQEGNPTLTADEGDYTLDTDILDIMDVYSTSGSQDYRMERISVPELLEMRRGASTMVGPARYYATAGANLLMVYPTPTGADELTVYFVPRPVTLAVGSDTPSEIPAEYHPAVEMYALWRLGSMRDDQTSSQGSRYKEEYEAMVLRARRTVALMGGDPPRGRVRRASRRKLLRRDVY
jgi:hypothetical protein